MRLLKEKQEEEKKNEKRIFRIIRWDRGGWKIDLELVWGVRNNTYRGHSLNHIDLRTRVEVTFFHMSEVKCLW